MISDAGRWACGTTGHILAPNASALWVQAGPHRVQPVADGGHDYTLHYGSGGAQTQTVAGTTATITAAISGGTAWVVANRNFGSTTWTSVASQTRTYTVAVVSLCG